MSTPLRERPDAPLGTLIFRAGLLPAETIENALEEGVKTGRRLGEILIERGLLQEEDLTRLLAGQKGLPFVSLRAEQIDSEAVRMLSEDQARLFSALPIRFEEGLPLVAVADPTNDVLNRNIREALGQDVRFVVAGRTELNEVIGEAYSGTLPTFTPQGVAEPEASFEAAPLRVDTSIPPAGEETPLPAYEPEPEVEVEAAPEFQVAPAPEPAYEAPVYQPEAPIYEPEPAPEPEPALEPEPELEPVAAFEAPSAPQAFEPPVPVFEAPAAPAAPEPVAPLATEPVAPQALPKTNGQVPHDLEDDLVPPEPSAPAEPAVAEPAAAEPRTGAGFRVSIRLTSGERLTVSECADVGEAKGYAKALTKQLGATDPDDWPFVNGRFLKPDTIVSVDVEES
jgi:Type II secretion system (T2SS), protein E, N-terminal domain